MLLPAVMDWVAGVAVTLKSGIGAAETVNVADVECVRLPLLPVIVRLAVPAGVVVAVVTVSVAAPDALKGEKLALAFAGKPLALNDTVPLKPLLGLTCTAYIALLPAITGCVAGLSVIVKSGTKALVFVELWTDAAPQPLPITHRITAAMQQMKDVVARTTKRQGRELDPGMCVAQASAKKRTAVETLKPGIAPSFRTPTAARGSKSCLQQTLRTGLP